jgi:hypothetical protein
MITILLVTVCLLIKFRLYIFLWIIIKAVLCCIIPAICSHLCLIFLLISDPLL